MRYSCVGKMIRWKSCKLLRIDHSIKEFMHKLESILENETLKILGGFCDTNGSPNLGQKTRPRVRKQEKNLPYFADPVDHREKIEKWKIDKFFNLSKELKKTLEQEYDNDTSCRHFKRNRHYIGYFLQPIYTFRLHVFLYCNNQPK